MEMVYRPSYAALFGVLQEVHATCESRQVPGESLLHI